MAVPKWGRRRAAGALPRISVYLFDRNSTTDMQLYLQAKTCAPYDLSLNVLQCRRELASKGVVCHARRVQLKAGSLVCIDTFLASPV